MNWMLKIEDIFEWKPEGKAKIVSSDVRDAMFQAALLERLEAIAEALQQIGKNQTVAKT